MVLDYFQIDQPEYVFGKYMSQFSATLRKAYHIMKSYVINNGLPDFSLHANPSK